MKKRKSIQKQTLKARTVLHTQRILKNTTIRRLHAENNRLRADIRRLKNVLQLRSPAKKQPVDQLRSASQKRIRLTKVKKNLGSSLDVVSKTQVESN